MSATEHAGGTGRRSLLLSILAVVVVVGLVGYGLYWFLYASHFETTDDAYVGGDVVAITSRENGTILALHADNTQTVRRGQLLVEIDPITTRVALDAAEADLARTVRNVRTEFAKVDETRAQLSEVRTALALARSDYRRRVSAGNAVSTEELSHARDAVTSAQASVTAAESALVEAQAAVQGAGISNNPDVLAAIAKVRQAAIAFAHMNLYAPVDGEVAQRTVQLGQQIAPGTPLMAVVPLRAVWVDANFKEAQLARMRVGQPVAITTDLYGGSVKFHGKIEGLGAGSGSAFALLPPQNASGNWIKIVQRVPVRIGLDPAELRDHPLRVGLSVYARVDVTDTSGPTVTSRNLVQNARADITGDGSAAAEAVIRRILSRTEPERMSVRGALRSPASRRPAARDHVARACSRHLYADPRYDHCKRLASNDCRQSRRSTDQGTWIITSFAVSNGVSVPLTGWFMGRYGVVRTFVGSVLLFTLASFLCGIAWSLSS